MKLSYKNINKVPDYRKQFRSAERLAGDLVDALIADHPYGYRSYADERRQIDAPPRYVGILLDIKDAIIDYIGEAPEK